MVAEGLTDPSPNQVVAEGLVGHRNAYLWSGWNWLDFVVVVVGWLTLSGATTGGMSALRSVRVLRPLRTITRVRGMKVLGPSLTSAVPLTLPLPLPLPLTRCSSRSLAATTGCSPTTCAQVKQPYPYPDPYPYPYP